MTSMTGLDVFDTTIHKTNSWLKEIMEELGIDNRHQAYQTLRGTLQALREWQSEDSERAARAVFNVLAQRISEGEVQDITGILPQDLRELWPAEIRR
jgi:uncharacterized protein (DUF2267 family)